MVRALCRLEIFKDSFPWNTTNSQDLSSRLARTHTSLWVDNLIPHVIIIKPKKSHGCHHNKQLREMKPKFDKSARIIGCFVVDDCEWNIGLVYHFLTYFATN